MDFALPELGEGVYEAELMRWLVQPGDVVKRGQPLLEVMTDKATMEVPSPFAGTLSSIQGEPGHKLKIGDIILSYQPRASSAESAGLPIPKPRPASVERPVTAAVASNGSPAVGTIPVAAPSVRHLARKMGVELSRIAGTGPAGRILLEDLAPHLSGNSKQAKSQSAEPPADYGRPGTRVKLQGLRRKIAEHLLDSKRRIPHYSYVDECDVTEMVRLRTGMRDACARAGIKLTYLPFFVKAVALALAEMPIVNSSLDDEAGEIVYHDKYDIGIAVATPGGLIVPVVREADKRDLFEIAREAERLGNEAKAGRSQRDDLRGGNFTVTSVGGIGGLISTPIINHPEVGIMGVGKVIKRPVYDEQGAIKPADLVYLSFSFDHRVLDGAIGAAFGNAVKRHLENPAAMLVPSRR